MFKPLLIIIAVCLSLVFVWFKDGFIMGTAESVLPFYHIDRYLGLTAFAWSFHPGLGNITGLTVASKPTYLLLAWFQGLGVYGYILQGGTFLFILLSGGIGSFLLMRELLPKLPNRYYMFGAFFYLFNPLSLVNVWNRFLPNFIFFYGLLPVGVWLFVKGLNKRSYYYAILLTIVLVLYSFAFSSIAFLFLFWIILALTTLFYLISAKDWVERIFYLKYLLLGFVFFILVNSWYLSQLFNYAQSSEFTNSIRVFHPQDVNVATLDSLSRKMGNLTDLYRLANRYFLSESELGWVEMYNSVPLIMVGLTTTAIALFGLVKGHKQRSVLVLGFIFLVGIFLSKGSNQPFGFVYKYMFEHLIFLQVFRNPIEKFSFMVCLGIAPLFGLGLYYLDRYINRVWVIVLGVVLIGVWIYPFFSGLVFSSKNKPNNDASVGFKVEVPSYYQAANVFLESQGNNFRVIVLPVTDEGITYLWNKGYQGADIPSALFSMPVVFFNTPVPYYYSLVKELESGVTGFRPVENGLLEYFLNVRFIFIRDDVDYITRSLTPPQVLAEKLTNRENNGELKKVGQFGKLTFWEVNNWQDATFYPANQLVATSEAQVASLKRLSTNQFLYEGERSFKSDSVPEISYQKINPTLYKVVVKGSSEPFILVFSETYHSLWQARINSQVIQDHLRGNIYANGWLIDRRGDFEIEVSFLPQSWLELGEIISFFAFVLGCSYLFIWRKSR